MTGPLHLQGHMTECTDTLGEVLRSAVDHPITVIRSLQCRCRYSGVMRAYNRHESSRAQIPLRPAPENERRQACRFFSIQINDEEGLLHALCRRCHQMVIVYDRALYWGVKKTRQPELFPYMCSCGGHTFELAMGFEYPDPAIDENDINTVTVAVRCASCVETAVILDDEG